MGLYNSALVDVSVSSSSQSSDVDVSSEVILGGWPVDVTVMISCLVEVMEIVVLGDEAPRLVPPKAVVVVTMNEFALMDSADGLANVVRDEDDDVSGAAGIAMTPANKERR